MTRVPKISRDDLTALVDKSDDLIFALMAANRRAESAGFVETPAADQVAAVARLAREASRLAATMAGQLALAEQMAGITAATKREA